MEAEPRPGLPVGVISAAVGVLVGSFLPWGTTRGNLYLKSIAGIPADFKEGLSAHPGFQDVTLPFRFWEGNVNVAGLTLPNWLVVAVALWVAVLLSLERVPSTRVPRWLPLTLVGYGALHLTGTVMGMALGKAQPDTGVFFTVACYAVLAMLVWRRMGSTQGRGSIAQPDELAGGETPRLSIQAE